MGRSDSGLVTFGPLLSATFVARPNRFLIVARRGRRRILAACRDPGRLEALLRPGSVAPCRTIDPDFGHALAEARRSGVRLLAFNCDVSPAGCRLRERIPVLLR